MSEASNIMLKRMLSKHIVFLAAALTLVVFACSKPEKEHQPNVVPVVQADKTAPSITVKLNAVNAIAGVTITIQGSELRLNGQAAASWTDDKTRECLAILSFIPTGGTVRELASGSILSEAGTLTLRVSDEAGNKSTVDFSISADALYGLESLSALSLQVDVETNLLQGITAAEGVRLEKVEIEISGERTIITDPAHFAPEYPATCRIILTARILEREEEFSSPELTIAPLSSETVALTYLRPDEILPIVGQIKSGDVHAYEHIEHLRIAEATRVRDMMWQYGAGSHSPEAYQALMLRLNTGMMGENPIGYDNYEIVGDELKDDPSEHAHAEWSILTTIVNHANLKIIDSYTDKYESLFQLAGRDENAINLFALSMSGNVYDKSNYWDMSDVKQYLRKQNLLLWGSGSNIFIDDDIVKYKLCQEDFSLPDIHSVYTGQSCANGINDIIADRHLMVSVGTNPSGDANIINDHIEYGGSKYPVGFHNNVLFAGRFFPYQTLSGKVFAEECNSYRANYDSSCPNYLNLAMSDLCFQLYAEIADVDELMGMIRATSLTDYVRCGELIQPLHLINPAGYIRKYLMPVGFPQSISTTQTLGLEKGYYKGVVFDIPGVEVEMDGDWIPYLTGNDETIRAANPFKLNWRLSGELLRKMGYGPGGNSTVEGRIRLVDDRWNALRLELPLTLTVE